MQLPPPIRPMFANASRPPGRPAPAVFKLSPTLAQEFKKAMVNRFDPASQLGLVNPIRKTPLERIPPMVIIFRSRIIPDDHPRFLETTREAVGEKVHQALAKFLRERQGTRKSTITIAENGQFEPAFAQVLQQALTLGNRGDINFPPLRLTSMEGLLRGLCKDLQAYLNSGAWPLGEELVPKIEPNLIRFDLRPYPLI